MLGRIGRQRPRDEGTTGAETAMTSETEDGMREGIGEDLGVPTVGTAVESLECARALLAE